MRTKRGQRRRVGWKGCDSTRLAEDSGPAHHERFGFAAWESRGPLTEFRRVRRSLPLLLERVKSGDLDSQMTA